MNSSKLADSCSGYLSLLNAKDNPLYIGLGALGVVGALAICKSARKAKGLNNFDGPTASSFFWGHAPDMFDPASSISLQDRLLKTYGAACRLKGEFGGDQLWIADPRAMHEILVKEHDDFKVPDSFVTWMKLVWGPTSMTTTGHRHKLHRKILNPVFATKCIRESRQSGDDVLIVKTLCRVTNRPNHTIQTPVMNSIAHQLEDIVRSKVQVDGRTAGVVDIYKWMNFIAFEIIGRAGMGCSFGVMDDKVPEYLSASRDMFPYILEMWYMRPFLPILTKLGPASFRRAIVERIPNSSVQGLKRVVDVMDATAADIIGRRSENLEHMNSNSGVAAEDLMTILLKHNQEVAEEEQLTHAEILAAVNGLVFGGHDTTSSALARTLHLLSERQDIQTKLRAEVREAHEQHSRDLDFEQLNSLPYLDAICREVLRLYPPEAFVERVATKDWVLPLQYPVKSKDGKGTIADLGVKKGTHIYVSLVAANRDKQTWGEDAEVFRPERWLEPLPTTVGESKMPGVFSSTMTFLGGPRACPGMRFAQLEMKVVLSALISSFKFDFSDETITWRNDVIVKPYTLGRDRAIGAVPSMPMRITVAGESD